MKLVINFFLLISISTIKAQEVDFKVPDSLTVKNFSELKTLFYSSQSKLSDSIYANAYLKKAFNLNDSIKIAEGYLFLTSTAKDNTEKEEFIDKSILFSKTRNNFLVPCTAYSIKAYLCKQKKQFKLALDYYLLTHISAEKGGNTELKHITKYNIGVLKTKIGDHREALNYFQGYWNRFDNEQKYTENHLSTFFALSNAYARNNKLDSASYFSQLGIKYSKLYENENQYYLFVFLEGVNKFYKKNYSATIDSINIAIPYMKKYKDVNNLAVCYTYLGKAYSKLDDDDNSIYYLKKVDSIFNKTNDLLPRSREVYKILIGYNKRLKNYKDQLYYTNQLLKLDSILTDDYKYLNSTIYKEYETPQLLLEKETLKKIFNSERKVFNKYMSVLLTIVFVVTLALIFNFYKRKKYQKKYLQFIQEVDKDKSTSKSLNLIQAKVELIDEIDEEIITKTIKNLSDFEINEGYLNNKITLNSLAKKVGTNSRYLSKIINTCKKKTYSNYLNDLRINFVINKLRSDEKFRKYTIDIIAKESGFNTRRSFSNVFQKKTGVSAAFFIDKLNAENKQLKIR